LTGLAPRPYHSERQAESGFWGSGIMTEIFGVRSADVVHETIDGETVIVDMAFGTYYRLEGAAAAAWQRLAAGASAADLDLHLLERFDAPPAEIESAVGGFLASLADYQLIAPRASAEARDAAAAAPADAAAQPMAGAGTAKRAFPGMAVHRFTDFQELFFIDPVHEVDETGWPAQPLQR